MARVAKKNGVAFDNAACGASVRRAMATAAAAAAATAALPSLHALSVGARDSSRRVGLRNKEQRAEGQQAKRQPNPKAGPRKPPPPAPQGRKGAVDPAMVARIKKHLKLAPDLNEEQTIARAWRILGMTGSGRLEKQANDILAELKRRRERAALAAKPRAERATK